MNKRKQSKNTKPNSELDTEFNEVPLTDKRKVNYVIKKNAPLDPRPIRLIEYVMANSFKLLLATAEMEDNVEVQNIIYFNEAHNLKFQVIVSNENNEKIIIMRDYSQLIWINEIISNLSPHTIVYPLPEPLMLLGAKDIFEEEKRINLKRIQIVRYLLWIRNHPILKDLEVIKMFFSKKEIKQDGNLANNNAIFKKLSFLPFHLLLKPHFERGFRVFRPAENPLLEEQEEFCRRQAYILTLETNYNGMIASLNNLAQSKMELGNQLHHFGELSNSCLHSKFRLGPTIVKDSKYLDTQLNKLALLMEDLNQIYILHYIIESQQLSIVFIDYIELLNRLKKLMNYRTECLASLLSYIPTSNDDEGQKEQLNQLENKYSKSKAQLTSEMIQFEKFKVKDLIYSIKKYANLQCQLETFNLQILNNHYQNASSISQTNTNSPSPSSVISDYV